MKYNPLGKTGLNVSEVAFGTGSLGEMFGPLSENQACDIIHAVIDAGINLIDTSVYYGSAEERIGRHLTPELRERVFLATKAGRFGYQDFDFSPRRIRESLENSLRLMNTDYVDIFFLHDIEYVPLEPVLTESFAELQRLKRDGKCRYIGMTGYPLATMCRVLRETDVDVILTYSKGTLLDDSLREVIIPLAEERGVGVMNAAALVHGLLSMRGSAMEVAHPWTEDMESAAARMRDYARGRGLDLAVLANQYAVQRAGAATTVMGLGKLEHLKAAVAAAEEPLDPIVEHDLLALRPPKGTRRWISGLPENN
nr:aldo/keto reductase [Propionicimonas sp.]